MEGASGRRRPPTGGYARGDEARLRIVEAALEVFGSEGFEGASTRAIAERAGVKLPALQYYFGGKEGLYRACAEHIAQILEGKLRPAVERIEELLSQAPTRAEALGTLQGLMANLADTLIGDQSPETWVMFIIREQARPTAAFDIIYERAIGRITGACVALTAHVLDCPRDSPETRVRAFGLVGQVLAFRAARGAALRTLGWPDFEGERIELLKDILSRQVAAALTGRSRPEPKV